MLDSLWQEQPVVTFAAAKTWLALHVHQIDRVIELTAEAIWRPPHLRREYLGLVLYEGALVPLLGLSAGPEAPASTGSSSPWGVVVRAHGQRLALPIERNGLLYARYQLESDPPAMPISVRDYQVQPIAAAERLFWLVDADSLLPMAA